MERAVPSGKCRRVSQKIPGVSSAHALQSINCQRSKCASENARPAKLAML